VPEHRLLARTLRGLEPIACAELRDVFPVADARLDHRELRFALPRLDARLLTVRTVDDMFLVVADWEEIPATRAALPRLRSLAARLDLDDAARTVSRAASGRRRGDLRRDRQRARTTTDLAL
jgi:tRNA (guanine6-N2)-methyltransferase